MALGTQRDDSVFVERVVAWSVLDFRFVGRNTRRISNNRQVEERWTQET